MTLVSASRTKRASRDFAETLGAGILPFPRTGERDWIVQWLLEALLRYAEARHDGAVISAWAQIAMANSSKATANRRFAGSSVASS